MPILRRIMPSNRQHEGKEGQGSCRKRNGRRHCDASARPFRFPSGSIATHFVRIPSSSICWTAYSTLYHQVPFRPYPARRISTWHPFQVASGPTARARCWQMRRSSADCTDRKLYRPSQRCCWVSNRTTPYWIWLPLRVAKRCKCLT